MRLSNLSCAVLVALGVAACGGRGGDETAPEHNNPLQPAPNPAPAPNTENPSNHDSTLVDPTQTHVVDDKDLLKQSTVGGLQYIRRDNSSYDRVYNPEKLASSTPLLGVPLDEQNPKLSNIVLARQDLTREDGQPVKAQFAGGFSPEPLTNTGRPQAQPSLQAMNFENVDVLAGIYKLPGSAAVDADGTPIMSNTPGDRQDYDRHVTDNVDKDKNITRDRVSHVYTLRFEYLQPYVDYPHATNPNDPSYYGNPVAHNHQAPDAVLEPAMPNTPANLEDLLKSNLNWAITGNNDKGWHRYNTGLGQADVAQGGTMDNYMFRFIQGGRTHVPVDNNEYAPGPNWQSNTRWRAHGRDADRSWLNREGSSVYAGIHYPNNPYPGWDDENNRINRNSKRAGIKKFQYNGWVYEDDMESIEPRQKGDPRYPNEPYDIKYNAKLSGVTPASADYGHEHTYLEVDEFTAIRRQKLIRPLVNPDPNTWQWALEQTWEYTPYTPQFDPNNNNRFIGMQAGTPTQVTGKDKVYLQGTPPLCQAGGQVACSDNWRLLSHKWVEPSNLKDGHQGAFRGPAYQGWLEDPSVIRFADARIHEPKYAKKYGADLVWWSTQDSAFENHATRNGWDPRARRVDNNVDNSGPIASDDLERKDPWDRDIEIQPTGDITNGLIRIGSSMKTLGQEKRWNADTQQWQDWHNTKTRIFGRYHLAWSDEGKIKPVTLNSYSGARSFVARTAGTVAGSAIPDNEQEGWVNDGDAKQARYDTKADLDSAPVEWSIGAKPITLTKVQYGRVTTNLDLSAGEGPFGGGFLHAPFAHKNDKGSVDNYFYRGVEATSIEQMASLPNEGNVKYEGHALMYGINNDFLGFTEYRDPNNKVNLPNAFAREQIGGGTAQMGLGNFVQADVNFANKKVEGDVYNAWLKNTLVKDNPNGAIVKDLKVHFKGDIMGNTVVGSADRVYAPGDDKADFRASFFGDKAQEMGGAFNTVTREDKYGSAYETGDWGGVFGAARSSGSASNTFQGEDGANHYGNTTVTNNYER